MPARSVPLRPMRTEKTAPAERTTLASHSQSASRNRPCVPPYRCADTTGGRFQSAEARWSTRVRVKNPLTTTTSSSRCLGLVTHLIGGIALAAIVFRQHLLVVKLPAHGPRSPD